MRILNFKGPREEANKLHKEPKTDKLKNILIPSCQFVYDQLKNNLPETFNIFFTLNSQLHKHNTRKNRLIVPNTKTASYSSNSITLKAIK